MSKLWQFLRNLFCEHRGTHTVFQQMDGRWVPMHTRCLDCDKRLQPGWSYTEPKRGLFGFFNA